VCKAKAIFWLSTLALVAAALPLGSYFDGH
jgi:hypothetical protein